VNAVLPGWTRTRLIEEWFRLQPDPAEAERKVLAVHPLGRLSTPMEVANLSRSWPPTRPPPSRAPRWPWTAGWARGSRRERR
jgi:NAD(P)-dependent dehydrogenase (short-subunit alcohol dehydrogenase family)